MSEALIIEEVRLELDSLEPDVKRFAIGRLILEQSALSFVHGTERYVDGGGPLASLGIAGELLSDVGEAVDDGHGMAVLAAVADRSPAEQVAVVPGSFQVPLDDLETVSTARIKLLGGWLAVMTERRGDRHHFQFPRRYHEPVKRWVAQARKR